MQITICDYLKVPLKQDDQTYLIRIEDQEFEVGEEGRKILLEQLEGDSPPDAPIIQEKIVYKDAPPGTLQAAAPGLDVQVTGDSLDVGPGSIPQPAQAITPSEDPEAIPPINIPAGNQRFKTTKAQRDQVVQDSRRFEGGTLPALTTGAKAQREASAKLRAIKDNDTNQLNRLGGHGIRLRDGERLGYNDR